MSDDYKAIRHLRVPSGTSKLVLVDNGSHQGCDSHIGMLLFLDGVHLGYDLLNSEAVHQLHSFGGQTRVFLGRVGLANVDLGASFVEYGGMRR